MRSIAYKFLMNDPSPDAKRALLVLEPLQVLGENPQVEADAVKLLCAMIRDNRWYVKEGTISVCWIYVVDFCMKRRLYSLILETLPFVIKRTGNNPLRREEKIIALIGVGRREEALCEADALAAILPVALKHKPTEQQRKELSPVSWKGGRWENLDNLLLSRLWLSVGIYYFRLGEILKSQGALSHAMIFFNAIDAGFVSREDDTFLECALFSLACLAAQGHPIELPIELKQRLLRKSKTAYSFHPYNSSFSDAIYIMGLFCERSGDKKRASEFYKMLIEREAGHLLFDRYVQHAKRFIEKHG